MFIKHQQTFSTIRPVCLVTGHDNAFLLQKATGMCEILTEILCELLKIRNFGHGNTTPVSAKPAF